MRGVDMYASEFADLIFWTNPPEWIAHLSMLSLFG